MAESASPIAVTLILSRLIRTLTLVLLAALWQRTSG
jgi:hypothetical protein